MILAHFFVSAPAPAQDGTPQPRPTVESTRLNNLVSVTRTFNSSYEVTESPRVSIEGSSVTVEIVGWDTPIVNVAATITVGAESRQLAEQFIADTNIAVDSTEDAVAIETHYPQHTADGGIGYFTDYVLSIPKGSEVFVANTWGKVSALDLTGPVKINAKGSPVELQDLQGPVNVYARDEFPLIVKNLTGGGRFTLWRTQAKLTGVGGTIQVDNYLGSVTLEEIRTGADVQVTSDSGPIDVFLTEAASPSLSATAEFGTIQSDVPLQRSRWASVERGVATKDESETKITLHTLFDTIRIHQARLMESTKTRPAGFGQQITSGVESHTYQTTEQTTLAIDAINGRINVSPGSANEVSIEASKFVQVTDVANARLALEGLLVKTEERDGELRVETAVLEDMEAIGCTGYRVDLSVLCPPGMRLRLTADGGRTEVKDLTGTVEIEQQQGELLAQDLSGEAILANAEGEIRVLNPAGPVTIKSGGGGVTVVNAEDRLDVVSAGGRVVVDSPRASVSVTNTGGDVRIVALDGVHGDYDILVEEGNISMAAPTTADASFYLNVNEGTYYSKIEVSGTSQGNHHTMTGRLNEGTHRVMLETQRGNIALD